MNLLLCINDTFARQAIVLLQSLVDNSREALHVCIVHNGLRSENQVLLTEFCQEKKIDLRLLAQDMRIFAGLRTAAPFPALIYCRILAHHYMPQDCDRVLYLDVDIICNGDIASFYHMDFQGNYFVACGKKEEYCDATYLQEHWSDTDAARGEYFNSGVLLINCQRFRKEGIDLAYYQQAIAQLPGNYLFDQGLLGYLFGKQTRLVSSRLYNYRYSSTYLENPDALPNTEARLIHYAGKITPYKPWDLYFQADELEAYALSVNSSPLFVVNEKINHLAGIWWSYAKKTPVYSQLFQEMLAKKKWFQGQLSGFLKRLSTNDCIS